MRPGMPHVPPGEYDSKMAVAAAQMKKRLGITNALVRFMEEFQCTEDDLQRALQSIRVLSGEGHGTRETLSDINGAHP